MKETKNCGSRRKRRKDELVKRKEEGFEGR